MAGRLVNYLTRLKMYVIEELTKLYKDKYDDYVRMYKGRAGANDVEDLVQEAFYRSLYYIDNYRPELADLGFWFSGIMENCLKDLYREKRDGASLHTKLTPESALIEPKYDEGTTKLVLKEIEKKGGDTRQILYLYFICGYKTEDVHKVIGGSLVNCWMAVSRFKEMLREKYPELGEN